MVKSCIHRGYLRVIYFFVTGRYIGCATGVFSLAIFIFCFLSVHVFSSFLCTGTVVVVLLFSDCLCSSCIIVIFSQFNCFVVIFVGCGERMIFLT